MFIIYFRDFDVFVFEVDKGLLMAIFYGYFFVILMVDIVVGFFFDFFFN